MGAELDDDGDFPEDPEFCDFPEDPETCGEPVDGSMYTRWCGYFDCTYDGVSWTAGAHHLDNKQSSTDLTGTVCHTPGDMKPACIKTNMGTVVKPVKKVYWTCK